jgi:hypothetical protein
MRQKKRYITPDPPKPSRIVNAQGMIYHPTAAPAGFCKCGVILQFKPKQDDYIFPSHARALHAREHTIRYMLENNLPVDPSDFIVEAAQ